MLEPIDDCALCCAPIYADDSGMVTLADGTRFCSRVCCNEALGTRDCTPAEQEAMETGFYADGMPFDDESLS